MSTTPSTQASHARSAAAKAFMHSLNILVKYTRMYGFDHKRTEVQFETAWAELQQALPKTGSGFLVGVSGNKLVLDGLPLDTGQAERSFAHLLNAAGLASIHFAPDVTLDDFARLVRAFTLSGSKAQDLSKQIKESLGDARHSTIKINEVKFVAADPMTGEVSVAAQIAAQTLGPEFKDWLNDPQKLLQLIAAAEGSKSGGQAGAVPLGPSDGTEGTGGQAAAGQVPAAAAGGANTGPAGGVVGGTVPLQEQEVIQAIRLLTRFGEVGTNPEAKPSDLQADLDATTPATRGNLQSLLESLAGTVGSNKHDASMLMKAAEHMAIRFALDRYTKGEVRVNAVHQMMEHMSRQMDRLRQILRLQEDKMSKAGMLIESHADIMDRMFWAEVPEAGKRSVLMSNEAPCVPPRNVRQYVESLVERGDRESVDQILSNYLAGLANKDLEIKKKTALGLSQLADLFAAAGTNLLSEAIRQLGEQLSKELENELESLVGAAFVRLSQEAMNRRHYGALGKVLESLERLSNDRPMLAREIRPRIGIENRANEFIEEALRIGETPPELLNILRRTPESSVEQLAERFFRCMTREECDRVVEFAGHMGDDALANMREVLRTGQPSRASGLVGLISRLDVPCLLELLPVRLKEFNRFYHDVVVRQIAYGAAVDRGRTLLELLELLDPLVIPQAVDEIGMSGDRTASAPLIVMAQAGDTPGRSALLQVKAIESLGRMRETEAIGVIRALLEARKRFKWIQHRELRVVAAQALVKIDPRYSSQVMSESGLDTAELALAPLDPAPACPWVRQRRYERFLLAKPVNATLSSSWGKCRIVVREMSLGGGLATKEENLRVGSEGNLEFSVGMRHFRSQVLLRRAKQHEFGYEIVHTDLDSRYRLRRLLLDNLEKAPDIKGKEWDGTRKT
jgi:hypothetical protein